MSARTASVIALTVLLSSGCGDDEKSAGNGQPAPGGYGGPGYGPAGGAYGGYGAAGPTNPDQIQFNDDAATNDAAAAQAQVPLSELAFSDLSGQPKQLRDLLGAKNLVVVLVRGQQVEGGALCPFCATQTSRLITNYQEFKNRDAEVVVVYPLAAGRKMDEMTTYLENAKKLLMQPGAETPFPVWLDIDLKAVNQLGLQAQLAKPTTYILDKQGRVRYAYVGAHMADRPSIKVMLAQLDALK